MIAGESLYGFSSRPLRLVNPGRTEPSDLFAAGTLPDQLTDRTSATLPARACLRALLGVARRTSASGDLDDRRRAAGLEFPTGRRPQMHLDAVDFRRAHVVQHPRDHAFHANAVE